MQDNIFSVSGLNRHIKALIEGDGPLANVFVRGEASNYKVYPSGHHYFTLKDEESSVRCVMFRREASRVRFAPSDGMRLIVRGRVSLFLRDGVYNLYCEEMIPDGVGELSVAFEQLKRRLAEDGLFDDAHKKSLPQFPSKIALVTSPAGAAVRDMIRIITRRFPPAHVIVCPVRVQGEEAPGEISAAIRYINLKELADLIIVGRGGGSLEDLWAFNDERVARAVYASVIPVISAVGHEPDVAISDFVADLRASTPSNAAELAVPDGIELRQRLKNTDSRLLSAMLAKLSSLRQTLDGYASNRIMKRPQNYLIERGLHLDMLSRRLSSAARALLAEKRRAFTHSAATLDAISPLKVLSRGYSIASKGSKIIRSACDARPGDVLDLRFSDGTIRCTVEDENGG